MTVRDSFGFAAPSMDLRFCGKKHDDGPGQSNAEMYVGEHDCSWAEHHVGKEIKLRIAHAIVIVSLSDRMAGKGRLMRMYLWVYSMSR